MNVIDRLNEALEPFEENFDRINWGGCGAMAAILAGHLEPVFPDLDIVTCGYGDDDTHVDEARDNIERNTIPEWNMAGVYFQHIWCEFTHDGVRYAVDSTGARPVQEQYSMWCEPTAGTFDIDEMAEMSAPDAPGWNSTFDRDQIESMVDMAAQVFNELKVAA